MKKNIRLMLTFVLCLQVTGCKTPQLTSRGYEKRTATTDHVETLTERDSLVMIVQERNDTVRIVQREIKWKERRVMRHDTVTVIKTDTLRLTEQRIRSPSQPQSASKSWIYAILTITMTVTVIITILKSKKLWDRLI